MKTSFLIAGTVQQLLHVAALMGARDDLEFSHGGFANFLDRLNESYTTNICREDRTESGKIYRGNVRDALSYAKRNDIPYFDAATQMDEIVAFIDRGCEPLPEPQFEPFQFVRDDIGGVYQVLGYVAGTDKYQLAGLLYRGVQTSTYDTDRAWMEANFNVVALDDEKYDSYLTRMREHIKRG